MVISEFGIPSSCPDSLDEPVPGVPHSQYVSPLPRTIQTQTTVLADGRYSPQAITVIPFWDESACSLRHALAKVGVIELAWRGAEARGPGGREGVT